MGSPILLRVEGQRGGMAGPAGSGSRSGRFPRLRRMYATFRDRNVPFMAGSVAFTAFVSLVPLLVLLYLLVTLVGFETLTDRLIAITGGEFPEGGRALVTRAIREQSDPASGSIVSIVVLVWGGFKLSLNLDTAFEEIYDSAAAESFLATVANALIAFGALVLAVAVIVAASVAFSLVDWVPYADAVRPAVLVAALAVAFLPIYYVFPNADVAIGTTLPGAVVAAVGWTVLETLFRVYVSVASPGPSGILGGVLLLLIWLYFGSLILLVGGVVNAVLAGRAPVASIGEGTAAGGVHGG